MASRGVSLKETKAAVAERDLAGASNVWTRFVKHVDVRADDECWEWAGNTNRSGYGHFFFKSMIAAHRAAYIMAKGPIPGGMVVCHRCDNKRCVNPAHLFPGTPAENVRDMMEKGRGRWPGPKGARQHLAKLTDESVCAVRHRMRRGESVVALAREYGVSESTIYHAGTGKTWKHVAVPPFCSGAR